jgi:pimeloyl-ACP methyl ester carboxylesterase
VLHVLEGFIDSVLPGERFLVAGTSYGAYLARGLVYRRGRQIDGLLLNVAGPAIDPPKRMVLLKSPAIDKQARSEGMAWLEDWAVAQNQGLLEYARVLHRTVADEDFVKRLQGGVFSFDVDRLPEPFPAPTLFVLGRQDDRAGYRRAWEILEQYPRATLAVLDRAGHLVWGEQRTLCLALAAEWLDRVEEWLSTQSPSGLM